MKTRLHRLSFSPNVVSAEIIRAIVIVMFLYVHSCYLRTSYWSSTKYASGPLVTILKVQCHCAVLSKYNGPLYIDPVVAEVIGHTEKKVQLSSCTDILDIY